MKSLAISTALALAACSIAQPPEAPQCPGKFPDYWRKAAEHCESCDVNRIKIDQKGSIFWNGTRIDQTTLARYLTVTTQMVPTPAIDLDYPSGTPCRVVADVRELMEMRLQCANGGKCRAGPEMPKQH